MATAASADPGPLDTVRAFNRFYTRQIGVLGEHLLDSPFSLTEMRVLYELAHRREPTASDLGRDLGLDAGYLSRILRRFERSGLIARTRSTADARHSLLRLTRRGRAAFTPLEARARAGAATMIGGLSGSEQQLVVGAMRTIERLLTAPAPARRAGEAIETPHDAAAPYTLRSHRPGDIGWVVHRHGAVYAEEWGYTTEFEAVVARICADFLDHFDPAGERCWIAERNGAIVGSVFVVRKSKTVAKLRLLLVERDARGLGLGRRLVDECIAFARSAGYHRLTLWTHSQLESARRIYVRAGFRRVDEAPNHSFGQDLVDETWDLTL